MKICMTGTHGTGKSTLAYMLKSFFPKFASVCDDARHMPDADGMSPEDKTRVAFERRVKLFEKEEDIISDRFFTDTYAYAKLLGMDDLADAALKETRRWMPDTVLAYVPIEFTFDRADARQYDRVQIDRYVRKSLDYIVVDANALGYIRHPYVKVSGCELTRLRAILAEVEDRGRQILIHGKTYSVNRRCEPLRDYSRVDPVSFICTPVKQTNCGSETSGSENKLNVNKTETSECSPNDKCKCGSAYPEYHDNRMARKQVNEGGEMNVKEKEEYKGTSSKTDREDGRCNNKKCPNEKCKTVAKLDNL